MSRKISQSNISNYFGQPVSKDVVIYRRAGVLPIGASDAKLSSGVTGICVSGSAVFSLQGVVRQLKSGEIFCILPGHIASLQSVSPDFEAHYVVISASFIKDITSRYPNLLFEYLIANPTLPMTEVAMDEAMRYLDLIEAKISERGNVFQKDIIFNILYSYYLDLYNMVNRDLPNVPLGKTANERIFDKFSLLVHLHYKESQSVAFYADRLHISAKHLSRVVRMVKGVSAKKWINDHLLFEVKQTLVGSQMSIQEVSDMYSFSSPDAMHHFFRKETGMSPSAFRCQK